MNQTPVVPEQTPMVPQPKQSKGSRIAFSLLGAAGALGLFFACQTLVAFLASIVITVKTVATGAEAEELEALVNSEYLSSMNLILVIADLLMIGILCLWFGCRKKKIAQSLGIRKVKPYIIPMAAAAGIGLSFALNILMVFAQKLFPQTMEDYSEAMESTTSGSLFAYILAGVILAPLVEEMIFRGLALTNLDRALPRGIAIVAIAAIFGIAHGNIVQGLYAGTLGVVLCCLYFAYDSILVPMALHLGFNAVSLLALIDVENLSTAETFIYSLFINLFYFLFVFGGLVALVFLFLKRTHPIFTKKNQKGVYAAHLADIMEEAAQSESTGQTSARLNPIPTVEQLEQMRQQQQQSDFSGNSDKRI